MQLYYLLLLFAMFHKRDWIQPSTRCRWPTVTGEASAAQGPGHHPRALPGRANVASTETDTPEDIRSQTFAGKDTRTSCFPKSPSKLATKKENQGREKKEKKKSHKFVCQFDTCQSTRRSCGSSSWTRSSRCAGCSSRGQWSAPVRSPRPTREHSGHPQGEARLHSEQNVLFYRWGNWEPEWDAGLLTGWLGDRAVGLMPGMYKNLGICAFWRMKRMQILGAVSTVPFYPCSALSGKAAQLPSRKWTGFRFLNSSAF